MPGQYRIFGGIFTPRPGPALFALCGIVMLLALGVWQLERRAWKHDLIHKIETRLQDAAMPLPQDFADPALFDYRRVWVTGTLRHDKEMHRAARDQYGRFGYHVLTPMVTEAGQNLLIDRGFVPPEKKPPDSRAEGQISGPATITGVARVPPGRGWLTPANRPDENFWLWIDLPSMASFAGVAAFQPVMIEADATPNQGGYPIGGQTRTDFPDNHLIYAVTWFSLALALAVIFFLAHWRRE